MGSNHLATFFKKATLSFLNLLYVSLAGEERLELPSLVLETKVLAAERLAYNIIPTHLALTETFIYQYKTHTTTPQISSE